MANQRYTGIHPYDRPEAFTTIDPKDVRYGDIFQGEENPDKWYLSEGTDVDDWRTYYRPVQSQGTEAAQSTPATPGLSTAPGMMEAAAPADGKIRLSLDMQVSPETAQSILELVRDDLDEMNLS